MQNKNKVGIVTLHGYHNYGNKLQNYALQKVINRLGYEANTLVIRADSTLSEKIRRRICKVFNASLTSNYRDYKNRISSRKFYKCNKKLIDKRTKIFQQFSVDYLNEIFVTEETAQYANLATDYYLFLTGSDQVWNPTYINDMHNYFLMFANQKQRVAYAPSFSCPSIPEVYQEKYRCWLLDMHKLSVRENEGADIIKELTDLEVPVLPDPTLLLSKED